MNVNSTSDASRKSAKECAVCEPSGRDAVTWLLGLGLFVAGVVVGLAVHLVGSAAAREIRALDRQWTMRGGP